MSKIAILITVDNDHMTFSPERYSNALVWTVSKDQLSMGENGTSPGLQNTEKRTEIPERIPEGDGPVSSGREWSKGTEQ